MENSVSHTSLRDVIINFLLKFLGLGITVVIGLQLTSYGYVFTPLVIYFAALCGFLAFFIDNNYSFKLMYVMCYVPFEAIFIGIILLSIHRMAQSNILGLAVRFRADEALLAVGAFGMIAILRFKALRFLYKDEQYAKLQSQKN